jgi:hypothetical protein
MHELISDPDVRALAVAADALKVQFIREGVVDPWATSPFSWILSLSSRRKGKAAEELVSRWCSAKGFHVIRSPDSEADRIIAGRRVEIKFSTLWGNGIYKFQQIRDQNYEYVICLGISPFDAHCWIIPKQVIYERSRPQHGGRIGTDTRWLSFSADQPPSWLDQYGGTLDQAYKALLRIGT